MHLLQRTAQLPHLPRQNPARSRTGNDSFKISYTTDTVPKTGTQFLVVPEQPHDIIARIKSVNVHKRHREPFAQHPGAHRRAAAVNGIHKTDTVLAGIALEHLKIAEGEFVHPDELIFVYP